MKTFTKLSLITACAVLFVGCGGGGANSTYTQNSQSTTTNTTNTPTIKGKLVDSPVEGVKYICGDEENFTDENGEFRCKELPVKFMVGNIILGEMKSLPKDSIVTPQDLAGVDRGDINSSKVCNIAILLQSLDDDGVIDDSITIDDEIANNLDKAVDIKKLQEEQLKELLEDAGVGFIIPKKSALEHLRENIKKITQNRPPYFNNPIDTTNSFGDTIKENTLNNLDKSQPNSDKKSDLSDKVKNTPKSNSTKTKTPQTHQTDDSSNSKNNIKSTKKDNNLNKETDKKGYFIVDTQEGVAVDSDKHLIWQNSNIGHGTREEATSFCKELSLGGIKWRLPTSSESKRFHQYMNRQGDTPVQAFSKCVAEVTQDGYIKTLKGAQTYGGEAGDSINFRGKANIRCVSDGKKKGSSSNTSSNTQSDSKNQIKENSSSNVNVKPLSSKLKKEFLKAINDARATGRECGEYGYFEAVPPLKWNDTLYVAAYRHSYDMAKMNYFSHTGSGKETDLAAQAYHPGQGSSMKERINYANYKWRRIGENIAAGTSMDSAKKAVEGWINSPGHCKNLMSSNFTEVSLAVVYDENSHYKYYWTQDFGTRK